MSQKSSLTPEQRVKFTCELSNTVLFLFFSFLKAMFPDFDINEKKDYLKQLVKERERNKRL